MYIYTYVLSLNILLSDETLYSQLYDEKIAYSISSIFPLSANTLHEKMFLPDKLKRLITRANIQFNINIIYYLYSIVVPLIS